MLYNTTLAFSSGPEYPMVPKGIGGKQPTIVVGTLSYEIVRRQIWAEAEIEKEALAQAIENYQTKVLKKAGKSDVRQTKWNGMMKQVQEAVKLYENDKMTGVKGKVKWALHRIRDGSKTMEHWCNLLPGGDYGGTIAGVFSMLATVSNRFDNAATGGVIF